MQSQVHRLIKNVTAFLGKYAELKHKLPYKTVPLQQSCLNSRNNEKNPFVTQYLFFYHTTNSKDTKSIHGKKFHHTTNSQESRVKQVFLTKLSQKEQKRSKMQPKKIYKLKFDTNFISFYYI